MKFLWFWFNRAAIYKICKEKTEKESENKNLIKKILKLDLKKKLAYLGSGKCIDENHREHGT